MSDGREPDERQAVVVDLEQRRRLRAARPAVRLVRRGEAAGAVVPLLRVAGRARSRRRRGKGRR
jgi:hypothetical protein